VSVIDVACAALGVDPMSKGLRILDALESTEPFRGPGPLLILQTYSREVLATVSDRLPGETLVTVLHHLGLDDQRIVEVPARELTSFAEADHLTSLYVEGLRTAGEAMDDLVSFTRRLRAECPWDAEQTHASLTRYLIEESYEALDALTNLAAMIESGDEDEALVAHAEEELGDLLVQVLFHAELADEEGRFNLATIADTERHKLTGRHPHVFGDVVATSAQDVAERWEVIKKAEKGRTSVLEGIAWQLPALALHAKVLKKGRSLLASTSASDELEHLRASVASLEPPREGEVDVDVRLDATRTSMREALTSLSVLATQLHVDLESLLREEVLALRDKIRGIEVSQLSGEEVGE
jgi:tetrapyrrole methylase family protein/MazG family protein